MGFRFDSYTLQANAFPVYVAILPLALILIALLPDNHNFLIGSGSAAALMPLAFLAAQVGADFGKRRERILWEKWGGPPTIRFLRHRDTEFNFATRQRVHTKLRGLGLHVPTAEEEQRDPVGTDHRYESCTQELIRRTRDRKRFPHVFRELTAYGFRRNVLGLKPIGLSLIILAFVVSLWKLWKAWESSELPAVPGVGAVISSILILIWVFWVNERTVQLAADRYARFLLEAALDLEV